MNRNKKINLKEVLKQIVFYAIIIVVTGVFVLFFY
ncbi:hypothetical protein CcarbDRAFT_4280 [Clostridium carboxidivorans P7]|uniref:Uncharacterized protein n=1 Tax=Clostridium carboxidivorans P7 TaxID=536227 RepID=C6PZR3_9CLOT|nr:hypothetical protein CcarbDRAFT_4280 [Clostridium carboxidivorans P7]